MNASQSTTFKQVKLLTGFFVVDNDNEIHYHLT